MHPPGTGGGGWRRVFLGVLQRGYSSLLKTGKNSSNIYIITNCNAVRHRVDGKSSERQRINGMVDEPEFHLFKKLLKILMNVVIFNVSTKNWKKN